MKISVITANYNKKQFLEECIKSVIRQRTDGVDVEYLVIDANSTDGSLDIIRRYEKDINALVVEKDKGPTDAINKGLKRASGDLVAWLNSDDFYFPGALQRVAQAMEANPAKALCFGHCPIVNESGKEIRGCITGFKEMFFPVSSRFTVQCINYVSQPAMFFRRAVVEKAGLLRTDLKCAWDYDYILKLWRHGGAVRIRRPPLAAFRWHEGSLSGQFFRDQFREEWEIARADSGAFSLQTLLHLGVRWGIVWSYSLMLMRRKAREARSKEPQMNTDGRG